MSKAKRSVMQAFPSDKRQLLECAAFMSRKNRKGKETMLSSPEHVRTVKYRTENATPAERSNTFCKKYFT